MKVKELVGKLLQHDQEADVKIFYHDHYWMEDVQQQLSLGSLKMRNNILTIGWDNDPRDQTLEEIRKYKRLQRKQPCKLWASRLKHARQRLEEMS